MSTFEFRLPDIGEGVHEGEIVAWHVAAGDVVREDSPMVEVMTDKATVTIDVPCAGTVRDIRFDEGSTAKVGEVIVVIATEGAATVAASSSAGTSSGEVKASAVGDIQDGLPGASYFAGRTSPGIVMAPPSAVPPPPDRSRSVIHAASADYFADKPLATPSTRKLARDLGIDLRRVPPSDPSGRVRPDDVRALAGGAPTATSPVIPTAVRLPSVASEGVSAERGAPTSPGLLAAEREERVPFRGVRRKIADRLSHSMQTAVHYTFVEECDMSRLVELRRRFAPIAAERGANLTFLPFIMKAVVEALKRHPTLNSMLDDERSELVRRNYYDIGVAADTEAGLMVPAVRDADRRSLVELALEIERVARDCREGKARAEDLGGTTFTITSLGRQSGLFATPVLNHPEVGILGVHRIKQKPIVRDGEIVIGDIALLSFSFDHRVVDGGLGARFAYAIIDLLESPESIFLDMV